MRRFPPTVAIVLVGVSATASALLGHGLRPSGPRHAAGSSIPGASGRIIANTFVPVVQYPESGPFSYTITVRNTGTKTGTFIVSCQSPTQLMCLEPDPNWFQLARNATQVVTISYTTNGLGHFNHTVRLEVDDVPRDSVTNGLVTVSGTAIQTHAPADQWQITASDSLIITYSHPSGVVSATFQLWVDGQDVTGTAQRTSNSLRRSVAGIAAGAHTLKSYGCAVNGRCDTLATTFTRGGDSTRTAARLVLAS
jgi:hypothetical protein